MRFSTFFILACLVMAVAVSGLDCYSAWTPDRRVQVSDHWQSHVSPDQIRVARGSAWGDRSVPQTPPIPPRQYPQAFGQQPNAHYSFSQIGVNDDVKYDGSVDFDWPRFAMALVLLTGGTLVCRRIFRSAAGPSRPGQLRQRPQPMQPARPTPPTVQAMSRMCPRADCGRMNPPMAKFCRRCGTTLGDA